MADINSLSSPDTGQEAAAPSGGSDSKNITPTNDNDAENMPLNDSGHSKKKDSNRATQKDRGHATRKDHVSHEAETGKTDEESDYEFADVSNPEEQYDLIMNKMMNMDEEEYQAYKKKHPSPNMSSPGAVGPEVAFKYLREMYDEDEEDEAKGTQKDHVRHDAETENADEEFDYEFADVSDHEEQCNLIMNKMLNMNDEEFKAYEKKHPWPNMRSPKSTGPEIAFKVLGELYDDSDEEENTREAAPSGSQPMKKQ
ncbi:hypothetical protein VE02_01956 [Pseudogymnoascus sp. 03VT05]|nr:hypothetical protein VE02_01956 [Pseudogymnoascus sp. 03VT05]